MRRKQLKQYAKLVILLLGIPLLLVNCQKDDDLNAIQQETLQHKSNFKASKVGKLDINNNEKLQNKLYSISEKIEAKRSAQNKIVYSSDYDFYIDTNRAIYIENTNYHSYTFSIERSAATNVLENLVLSLQPDGTYKSIIVTYNVSNEEKSNLINRVSFDLANKVSSYEFDGGDLIDDIFSKDVVIGDCVGILMCPYANAHPATQVCIDQDRGDLYLDTSICEENDSENNNNESSGGESSTTSGTNSGGEATDNSTSGTDEQNDNGGTSGNGDTETPDVTLPVFSTLEEVEDCLQFTNGFNVEMLNGIDREKLEQLNGFLQSNGCNQESQDFAINAITILMADPTANPLLGVDCRSFEYAQPPGALQKACAVSDFTNRSYGAYVEANGSAGAGYVESHWDIAYFTMPPGMTNGQAANLTAEAITQAIHATDVWFIANASETQYTVGQEFIQNIQSFMGAVGGQMVVQPPFNIPSPAPYLTHMGGATTNCN